MAWRLRTACFPWRRLAAATSIILAMSLPAGAIDIAQAERDGLLIEEALALGANGKWRAAEAAVADGDLLLQDIVLWRKLRAGEGTVREYQSFVSRRGTWPGQDILAEVVMGERRPGTGRGIRGSAAEAYRQFRSAMKRDRYAQAEKIILQRSTGEEALGSPEVWADRRLRLARRAAREGRAERAYALASRHHLTPDAGYAFADCEWVAGWVALRKLNDPARAVTHFERFHAAVTTPISLGRGGYWLGRAHEALGNEAEASRWYAVGARHQTSFYGQLAAAKVSAAGNPSLASGDLPDWRNSPAMRADEVRLATTLHFAEEKRLAMATFSHLGRTMPEGALGPLSRLVLDLKQPHYAVRIAKRAARRGILIYPAYYPLHDLANYASAVEPAFAMAIARQETELNPKAISRAGARGLMQLMPATAKRVASWVGEEYSRDRLIEDWRYNARLGQTYLARRVQDFGGSYVMAAAAYNAGAHRVSRWVDEFGDPRLAGNDVIDWIEQIPFEETRNYVQRVMEGLYVYRARLAGSVGPMTIEQDLARGIPVPATRP